MIRPLRLSRSLRFPLSLCIALALAGGSAIRLSAENICYNGKHVAPGVEYFHKQVSDVPWSVHVVRIDRRASGLEFITTMPTNHSLGLTKTTEQLSFIPARVGRPLAAINGDFFSWPKGPYQGDPAGLQISFGEMVSAPPCTKERMIHGTPEHAVVFWVDEKQEPHIDKVSSQMEAVFPNGTRIPISLNQDLTNATAAGIFTLATGTSTRVTNGVELVLAKAGNEWLPLQAGTVYSSQVKAVNRANSAIAPDEMVLTIGDKLRKKLPKLEPGLKVKISTATLPSMRGIPAALSGAPVLVENRKTFTYADTKRNPRTAVGYNDRYVFFVVVDGRRAGVSDGMSFEELSKEMAWWGCDQAMNLDGGGSATIWVAGQIMNQPSDNKERAVANTLAVIELPKR